MVWRKVSQGITLFNHQSIGYLKAVQQSVLNKLPCSFYLSLNADSVLLAGFNYQRLAIYNQLQLSKIDQLIETFFWASSNSVKKAKNTNYGLWCKRKDRFEYASTQKYFPNIQLGERPKGIIMHPIFNELEDHEYVEVLANL